MATTYAYLVDPNKQYMTKSGTINVNGTLRVYDAATDDIVITYKDFNGTENEASITLDNNGRAIVIADSSRAYRLEVYDRYGSLQWTVSPLWCLAAGGGVNVHTTRVISTDGSIDVDQIDVGSTTTFDIGIAPSDSMEYLEWVKCNDENISNGTWYPTYAEGTMETYAGEGLHVGQFRFYHITSTLNVDPTGNGINYDTLSVSLIFNDGSEEHELIRRDFDIDNSVNDPTLCEFSYDFACPDDGFVYIKVEGVNNFTQVDSELQVHRIYSGINAVPDSCAAKPWVSEYFEEKSSMSAYIPFSGLDYNQGGAITGISGSAIYAALDSGTVSAIASSYAESAISSISGWSADFSSISSKIDWSSSGVFQPSGDYQTAGDYAYNSAVSSKVDQSAFEQCCDEVHSALDEKLDKSASSEFQPSGEYVYESAYSSFSSEVTNNISIISSTVSGLTGQYIEQSASSMFQPSGNYASASDLSAYVPFSGIEGEGGRVTGISGSAIKGHEYTGINPVVVDNTADTISVEHRTLCVDSTMTTYNSGDSAVIGVNVAGLDISSKMDASASSLFYSTSNPSGFIDGASASAIASAYAESAASSKMDESGMSAYVPFSAIRADENSAITSINGSSIGGGGGGGASIPFIGNYYDSAESATATITADVSSVNSLVYTKHDGNVVNTYKGIRDTLGLTHLSVASFIAPGAEINGKNNGGIPYTMSFAPGSSMWTTADAATGIFSPLQYGTGAGMFLDNSNFKGYLKGNEWFVSNTAFGYARGEVHQSRGSRVIVEHTGGAGAVLSARNNYANVTLNSTAHGTAQMAVAYEQAYVQVQRGNSDSKYNSAKLDTDYLKFYNSMTTGYLDPEDTASGTAYMPAETEYMYISSIPYWNEKIDGSALGWLEVND